MPNGLKSKPCSAECSSEMLSVIDEKHGVGDVVFLTKFLKKILRHCCCSGRKQPNIQEFVCVGLTAAYSQNC